MKVLVLTTPLLLATLPGPAHAQLDVILRTLARPTVRGDIGPWSVSATLGAGGVDLRIDERGAASRDGGTTRPRGTEPARTGGATSATAASVLGTADRYVGTPYVWGGESPSGFDCSGFVQYVFQRHGVELPRTSRQQGSVGQRVAPVLHALQPGDLMLFATRGGVIDHIAIYAGGNRIIHSSSSGGGVGYDDLSSKRGRWFADHHVVTRRVLADGRSLVADLDAALRAFAELDPPDEGPRRR